MVALCLVSSLQPVHIGLFLSVVVDEINEFIYIIYFLHNIYIILQIGNTLIETNTSFTENRKLIGWRHDTFSEIHTK